MKKGVSNVMKGAGNLLSGLSKKGSSGNLQVTSSSPPSTTTSSPKSSNNNSNKQITPNVNTQCIKCKTILVMAHSSTHMYTCFICKQNLKNIMLYYCTKCQTNICPNCYNTYKI